jgi:hypothetical protein
MGKGTHAQTQAGTEAQPGSVLTKGTFRHWHSTGAVCLHSCLARHASILNGHTRFRRAGFRCQRYGHQRLSPCSTVASLFIGIPLFMQLTPCA